MYGFGFFVPNTNYFFLCLYDYSDIRRDQSGMIDMTDASPDLNPGTLFFH
jgi:hypothetical protein